MSPSPGTHRHARAWLTAGGVLWIALGGLTEIYEPTLIFGRELAAVSLAVAGVTMIVAAGLWRRLPIVVAGAAALTASAARAAGFGAAWLYVRHASLLGGVVLWVWVTSVCWLIWTHLLIPLGRLHVVDQERRRAPDT